MEEQFATPWVRFWAAAPALMFRRGRVDTGLIGTFTLPNQAIHHGVMKPFLTCIDAVSRTMSEALIRITAGWAEQCTCSPLLYLTRFLSLCWKALNRWGSS